MPRLTFIGDSDAHIVKGLIAILFALYSGKTAKDILSVDANHALGRLHLTEHLTPQRSNGLMAMVKRIRTDAEQALSQAAKRISLSTSCKLGFLKRSCMIGSCWVQLGWRNVASVRSLH